MHSPRRAATAAITLSLVLSGGIAVAHADSSSTLYVDSSSSACTDSGTGTQAAPYCTIQAAADAAVAGDTVDIEKGVYKGAVDVKSVGTAAAPIVFQAVGGRVGLELATGQTGPVLSFDGASYVTFEGGLSSIDAQDLVVDGAVVSGSSHITLDELEITAAEVTGTSTDVTISRDWFRAAGVTVDAGSSDDVISTNWFIGEGGSISVADSANTAITSNTLEAGGTTSDAINVSGASSTGVTIENNILAYPGATTGNAAEIAVNADAAKAGTKVDYNVVWPVQDGGAGGLREAAYSWAGVDYASSAALYAATGEAKHDLTENPWFNPAPYNDVSIAPQNNSANSAAPGMLDTDIYGNPCVGDPIVAAGGAGTSPYCARGAVQPEYTTTVSASATPVTALSVSLNSALNQTVDVDGTQYGVYIEGPPAVSYTVNWGDGTTKTYAGSSTHSNTADTHTYAKMGTYTITDTADFSNGTTAVTTTSATTAGSGYTPFGPTRILDTRSGIGAPKAKVATGSFVHVKVAGLGSIPADVTAVALNVTETDATGNGYVSIGQGGSVAATSTLNYLKGQTIANSVIAPVFSDGTILVANEGNSGTSADLIADISGYFTPQSGDGWSPVTLKRILDTRDGTGAAEAKVAAGGHVSVAIAGADSIPSGVKAVAVHVTVTDATGNGWIAAAADGAGTPSTSILNYLGGQTVSNTVIVPVAADGKMELYNGEESGSADLIADVAGYFSPASTDAYVPITGYRVFDSRDQGELTPDGTTSALSLAQIANDSTQSEFPAGATMVTNLTMTEGTANGYITIYPAGTSRPSVSDVNYLKGQTLANLGLLPTDDATQDVDVYNNSSGTSDLIVDEYGYFANS